ncbi:MAG: MarR family transcriptional regulator, partial [Candidatus Competibacterales bacterium]|nr:MarR family transcriptional regulator [Candidatus Competibacterales bacterium]
AHQALRAWLQLLKCAKRIEQRMNLHFQLEYRSSLSRFDVLAQLARVSPAPLSTGELAERLLASRGNISRLLDRMAVDGLIRRLADEGDRRIVMVYLTRRGDRLFRRMAADHRRWTRELFDSFGEHELHTLNRLLHRLREQADGAEAES